MYYLITLGTNESNDLSEYRLISTKTKQAMENKVRELCENDSELVFEYIHNMTVLGNTSHLRAISFINEGNTKATRLWALIMINHEICNECDGIGDDNIENNITALVFAESEEQAFELLRKHPKYLECIDDLKDYEDKEYLKELDKKSPVTFCTEFLDGGQLMGDWLEIPSADIPKILKCISSKKRAKFFM